jgi:trehalose 6-phosphate synthase/phosphatase
MLLNFCAAGSILVNPWNINDVAAAIEDAFTMSEEEEHPNQLLFDCE